MRSTKASTKLKLFLSGCGCGNSLVIAYRELRLLELDILRRISMGKINDSFP